MDDLPEKEAGSRPGFSCKEIRQVFDHDDNQVAENGTQEGVLLTSAHP